MKKPILVLKEVILVVRKNGIVVWSKNLYGGDVRFDVLIHSCPYPGRPLPQDEMGLHHHLMNRNQDELSETAEDQLDALFDNEFLDEPPH